MSEDRHVAFDTDLCAKNPEAAADRIAELEQQLAQVIMKQDPDWQRLKAVEVAARRLAYIVRKSINSGPISNDPTSEGQAWRELRKALGEGEEQSLAEAIGLGIGGRGVAEY
jgi:hypothetical protein